MADDLPSATPEESSNDKTAADESGDKYSSQPQKKLKPAKGDERKKSRLSKADWREFAGILVLIPWLWYDLVDSHGIIKLCLLAIGLSVAHGLACYFLSKLLKSFRWGIFFWIILSISVASVISNNLRPQAAEPKPSPHFVFSLLRIDNPYERLNLTNDFLIDTNFNTAHTCEGGLIVPLESEQTNVLLRFGVENNSSVIAEDGTIVVMIPEKWEPVVDPAWHPVVVKGLSFNFDESGPVETNVMLSWAWNIPILLGGNGTVIPDIQLRHPMMLGEGKTSLSMFLQARAKDSPTSAISFWLHTFPNSVLGTNAFHKPFVILGTNVNKRLVIDIPPERFRESK